MIEVIEMDLFMSAAAAVTAMAVGFVLVSAARDSRRRAGQREGVQAWITGTAWNHPAGVEPAGPAVVLVQVCESCRQQPVTLTVTVIDGSPVDQAFRVCRDCGLLATQPAQPVSAASESAAAVVRPRIGSDQSRSIGRVVMGERTGHESPAAH